MSTPIRVLTREDVLKALTMQEAVALMRTAFTELSLGRVTAPQRLSVEMPEQEGRVLLMPIHMPAVGQFGLKLVSLFTKNPDRGLPYIHAVMLLLDGNDGRPLALMDAEHLTALRTGAATALATDLLARRNSSALMVFGAGAQARFQVEGVCAVRPIHRVVVYDPHPERAARLIRELPASTDCELIVARSPRAAAEVDIICTATTSRSPVFEDADIRPGTHINGIGAYRHDMCEIPPATLAHALILVDSRSSALEEAGDIIQAIRAGQLSPSQIQGELGEIVSGKKPGRTSDDQITVFKSVGNASQDLVAAQRILVNAEKLGLGAVLKL